MPIDTTESTAWFKSHLPAEWKADGGPEPGFELMEDRDEIVVICGVPGSSSGAGDDPETAQRAAVKTWRNETREQRMAIASNAQDKFGKHISWGVSIDGVRYLFTHLSVPAMTRLKVSERQVLDTLVDAGVATSRSEALAWCVRYVAKKEEPWLKELRSAFESVADVRAKGPKA